MDLLTKMVEHHVWLTGEMVRVAERLTDEQLDQPIELDVDDDRQTIRSLLSRLVGQMGMWNAALATRDYDWSVEEHESLTSMRERLAVEGPTYLAHVREVVGAGPARRHLRRRPLRAGRGVHVRRDDRPRADLRRPPADPRRAGLRPARRRRARLGRPDASGWPSPPDRPSAAENDRVEIASSWSRHGRRRPRGHRPGRRGRLPGAAAADRRRHRRVLRAGRPRGAPRARGRAARAAAAAALPAALQTSLVDFNANRRPILLLSVGLVVFTTARRRLARARDAPGHLLAGGARDRRGRRAARRGRRDRDRPPDRAATTDRDHPRGRVAAQRRDRAGRAAHGDRRRRRLGITVLEVGVGLRASPPAAACSSAWRCSWWSRYLRKQVTDPVLGHRHVVRGAVRGVRRRRGGARVRRRRRRRRRAPARAQGTDPADRAVADRGADELAHHRLRPGERRLPADRPAGASGSSATSRTASSRAARIVLVCAATLVGGDRAADGVGVLPSATCWCGPGPDPATGQVPALAGHRSSSAGPACAAWSRWPRRS